MIAHHYEANIAADLVKLVRRASPCCRIIGFETIQIHDWDLLCHQLAPILCLSNAQASAAGRFNTSVAIVAQDARYLRFSTARSKHRLSAGAFAQANHYLTKMLEQ